MKSLFKLILCMPVLWGQALSASPQGAVTPDSLSAYIRHSWNATVRFRPTDSIDHIGLPHPYTVPCKTEHFQEMYYWDTYFTNVGLLIDGRQELAIGNTENLAAMVARFGKILNGSRLMYQDHSQPPYLCMMVDDIFSHTGDKVWLARMYPILKREYQFWMTRRLAPCGLNHYATDFIPDHPDRSMAEYALSRTKRTVNLDTLTTAQINKLAFDARAECESGWDFTPRFENRCADFCPVDLNANLYFYETHLAQYARLTGHAADIKTWQAAAHKRRQLIMRYLYNAHDGLFYDYDYIHRCQSTVKSCAVFSLLLTQAVSLAVGKKMTRAILPDLECAGGLAATAPLHTACTYQWAYPNGWAPLQYVAIRGMDLYGMKSDAQRLARKYVDAMTRIFAQTGNLWEKINVVETNTHVNSEGNYTMPPMMGWTAGVFEYALNYLEQIKKQDENLWKKN